MTDTLTGLGGSQEVGRSSFLLDVGEKILLDRGVKVTPEGVAYPLPVTDNLDAVVISHAHLDHSGNLPELYVDGSPKSYMTPPTLDIAELLWFDTLKIADIEELDPPFSKNEIVRARHHTFPLGYNKHIELSPEVSLEFFDAGHIVGSALCHFHYRGKTFLYTGDVKFTETRLHKGADIPKEPIDYVVIEGTYGNRDHPDRAESEKTFIQSIRQTLEQGGHALVPAFAVGRSAEIIDVIYEHKIDAPVFLDGMGVAATRIALKYPGYLKDPETLSKAFEAVNVIGHPKDRHRALKEPSVVVTTAGMLEGGPIMHYLKKVHDDDNTRVLLTGYQVEDTKGHRLLNEGRIEIDGKEYQVAGKVEKYDFSAHAARGNIIEALKKWNPKHTFLVHGDAEVLDAFQQELETSHGLKATALERGKPTPLD